MSDEDAVNLLIGVQVRDLRRTAGLTQADVAKAVGCTRSSIANIEGGRQAVSAAKLVGIARALGVSPGELLDPTAVTDAPLRKAALGEAIAGMHRRVSAQHEEILDLVTRHMAAVQHELRRIERVLPALSEEAP